VYLGAEVLGTSLEDQAEIIAKAEGVEPWSVELVSRFIPGTESNKGRPTILIVAKWSEASPPVWERIVKQTKKFVDSSLRGRLEDLELSVEMIAEELICWNISASCKRETGAGGLGKGGPLRKDFDGYTPPRSGSLSPPP
jgi:hypothetical protein